MDLGLKGKAAIVCGASRGIGKAIAMGLAAEGTRVALCARTAAVLEKTASEIREATGAEVLAVPTDLSKPADITALVSAAVERFGGVQILVNNAGGPPGGLFMDLPEEKWQAAFELSLLSVVRCIRLCVPHMKRAGGGRIINLESSSVKQPVENLILSNAIRSGVIGLAKSLADEFASDKITVNNVLPGRIETDRFMEVAGLRAKRMGLPPEKAREVSIANIPLGRLGRPEEVADVVVFLASERAAYLTGVSIQVDGGLIRSVL